MTLVQTHNLLRREAARELRGHLHPAPTHSLVLLLLLPQDVDRIGQ